MGEKERASATVVPLRRRSCSHCGKPVVARWRPFCSKRCGDLDLGRWLSETYRIPTNEEAEMDTAADEHDDADR